MGKKREERERMPRVIEVAALSDPALDVFSRLTGAQLRSRRDPGGGLFVAESPKVIGHALDAGLEPVSLLMERRKIEGSAREIVERCGDIPLYTGEREVLAELTGYELTRGVLCAFRRPEPRALEEVCASARRLVILENLTDPTNVGAVFRSAAALGMDGVLVTPSCCDPLHRRAVRVSMGTVFQIPWAALGDAPAGWPERGLAKLRGMGFRTAALALREDAVSIGDPELARTEKLALVLGTEGDGLAPATVAACDVTVKIPMTRGVDSLNVAAAGAVAFWQLARYSQHT